MQVEKRGRRAILRYVTTATLILVAAVLLLPLCGLVYQWAATRWDEHRYPMPGRWVEVEGHRMHLDCRGAGSPTVLLDAGLGDSSATWALVQPQVARFTRVCSYDRPGLGWSEPAPGPRDSVHVAALVEDLLKNAHVAGPYILVGHSFGGYNQLLFWSLHHDQVAGMVLVDSSHPDQLNRFPPSLSPEAYIPTLKYKLLGWPFGLGRLLRWCRDDYTFPDISQAWQQAAPPAIALDCRLSTLRSARDEELWFRRSGQEAASITTLGNLPLVVLSHDPQMGSGFPPEIAQSAEKQWSSMQEELRSLSTNSKRIIARRSMHYVEAYRPELVIRAIHDVYVASISRGSIAAPTSEE
jgi:pimeloyl-ACP methyl ester carboxylesterase